MVYQFKRGSDGRYSFPYCSEGVRGLFGLAPEEIGDDAAAVLALIHREDRARVTASIETSAARLEPWREEYRIVDARGAVRYLLGHANPLREADGAVMWCGYTMDVSADNTAKMALREAASERQRMQRSLQQAQKMEAIGLLTGGIAHDFNNILASILGYAGLAMQRLGDATPSKLADYVREVQQAGERGQELVSQMLAFSRGEGAELRPAALPPLIEQALRMVRPTLPSSLDFSLEFEAELPLVMTSSVQIQQIMVNLCINARDALAGTGTVIVRLYRSARSGADCASCHSLFGGDYVVLSLADNGPGMTQAVRERVFEPFYSTKSASGGTGMGLAMVHGFVHGHGGHITLVTAPGRGTRFDIHFPIAIAELAAQAGGPLLAAPRGAPRPARVLVVDDERPVGGFIGELLEMNHYAVVVESDALAALARLRTAPTDFDLLITDQTMPGMSGAQLAQAALALRASLPIIMISGYSTVIDAEQAARIGVRGFLSKPIRADDLLEAIGAALEQAATQAAPDAAQ